MMKISQCIYLCNLNLLKILTKLYGEKFILLEYKHSEINDNIYKVPYCL